MANNSWGTPPHFIESARKVMGSIDTDPASNDEAQYLVQAGQYFTEENSGLEQYWNGNVWLNPPYGRGLAKPFINQVVHQYKVVKCVTQAVVLLNSVYSSAWWKDSEIAQACSAICLPDHRIAFINPDTGNLRRVMTVNKSSLTLVIIPLSSVKNSINTVCVLYPIDQ